MREPLITRRKLLLGGGTALVLALHADSRSNSNFVRVGSRAELADLPRFRTAFLSERGRQGRFHWVPRNLAQQVSLDGRQGIYVASNSDLSGASGAWVRDYEGSTADHNWFGIIGDGRTSDSDAINQALAALPPGQELRLGGGRTFACASTVRIPAGRHLRLEGTLSAAGAFPGDAALVEFVEEGQDQRLSGPGRLDCAGNVRFAVRGVAVQDAVIEDLEIINWTYGIYLVSNPARPLRRPRLSRLRLHSPGRVAVYPIQVSATSAGQNVEGARLEDLVVIGVGGDFQRGGRSTADQIALQGVEDAVIANARCSNGGENNVAISRCCQRIQLVGGVFSRADKNGVQVGSNLCEIDVADPGDWRVGQSLTGRTSGKSGEIEAIINRGALSGSSGLPFRVRLKRLSPGFFLEDERVGRGSTWRSIGALRYTDHVTMTGTDTVDNGADVSGAGATRAGVFLTRARWFTRTGGVSGNLETDNQQYSVYATNSIWVEQDVQYRNLRERWRTTGREGRNLSRP